MALRIRNPPPVLGERDVHVFAGVEDASLGLRFLDGPVLLQRSPGETAFVRRHTMAKGYIATER